MKNLIITWSNLTAKLTEVPLIVTRLIIGYTFISAGWGKFQTLDQTVAFFESIGIAGASFQAPFVALVEFLGGLLILVGLGTRIATIPLSFVMVVALATAHSADINGVTGLVDWAQFLYIILMLWLTTSGGGRFSVDALLKKKLK